MWSETVGLRTRPVWDQKIGLGLGLACTLWFWSFSLGLPWLNSTTVDEYLSGLTSRQPHALGQDWQLLLATAALRSNYFFSELKKIFFQKTELFFFQNSKIYFFRNWNHAYFPRNWRNIFVNWVAPVRFRSNSTWNPKYANGQLLLLKTYLTGNSP